LVARGTEGDTMLVLSQALGRARAVPLAA
jgi:hypothetical protein